MPQSKSVLQAFQPRHPVLAGVIVKIDAFGLWVKHEGQRLEHILHPVASYLAHCGDYLVQHASGCHVVPKLIFECSYVPVERDHCGNGSSVKGSRG